MSCVVLVVDDNDSIRRLVVRFLQRDGYVVEQAIDGVEAIANLKNRTYHAVLLDLMMPKASGYDVLAFLRKERPKDLERVIVMTAAAAQFPTDGQQGIFGVISKPFEIDYVRESVKSCVELYCDSD